MQDMVLLPALVKAHGHDHEQPLIGLARDEALTDWLDHAVNPFTGFMNAHRAELSDLLGCSPQLAVYRMARVCDIHYGITASMVHHCNWFKAARIWRCGKSIWRRSPKPTRPREPA